MRCRCPVPGISPMRMPPTNASPFHFAQLVAGVDRQARGRDRRHPVDDGVLEAFAREAFRLPRPRIRAARADERPAVVRAGLQDVDLVAAVRAVLALPELAGRRDARRARACCDGRACRSRACSPRGPRTDCRRARCRRRSSAAPCRRGSWDSARRCRRRRCRTCSRRACRRGRTRAATRCSRPVVTKMSRTSVSALPSKTPRATPSPFCRSAIGLL